jgi:hypothetical protein
MASSNNPARAASPSSFYALSDDEEGEYDTIAQTGSRRGVKLLFSKSKVGLSLYNCLLDDPKARHGGVDQSILICGIGLRSSNTISER